MKISTAKEMQDFLRGVFCGRPGDHHPRFDHAQGVTETLVLALASAVMTVADANTIEVFERQGRVGNMSWFEVGGKRHALIYRPGGVCLHRRSRAGYLLETFSKTNIDRIWPVFSTL